MPKPLTMPCDSGRRGSCERERMCGASAMLAPMLEAIGGVGSDLDLIIIVRESDQPFERRAAAWDVTELPVPTDVLVYTEEEWRSLPRQGRFYLTVMREGIWVWEGGA